MTKHDWRTRLQQAIEKSGRSMRDISLKAKLNPGYISGIFNEGKDPTVEKLIAVCKEIKTSPTYILYGIDVMPEDAEIIEAMREDPSTRDAVLSLLRRRSPGSA